jgi:rhamnosyltransferase subunit B
MSRRIILATLGSLGDLHPFIALALRLQAHGYDPVIATSPDLGENVIAAGVNFHPMGPRRDTLVRDLGMDLSEFGRKVMQDTWFILEGAVFPYLQAMYDELLPVIDGAALMLSSSLMFSARFAAQRLGIPQMAVALQPMVFLSAYDPPALNPLPSLAPWLLRLGPRVTRAVHERGKTAARRRAAALYAFHRRLGLSDSGGDPLFEGQFSCHGTFAMYSRLLARIQPDYPPKTLVSGFAFYDGHASALDQALEDFLAAGPAPVVFTLGSFAVEFADDFFRAGIEASRRIGLRAIALVGARQSEAYRGQQWPDVHIAGYARYSLLFPRARAIVHHGGIGTLGQALRAGKPQLIVPLLTDQFDNAARAVRLGVARALPRKRYSARRLAAELARLAERRYAGQAAALSLNVAAEDGAEAIARTVDDFLGTQRLAARPA